MFPPGSLATLAAAVSAVTVAVPASAVGSSALPDHVIRDGVGVRIDAYPATAAGSPVVIAIHGGGWEEGDKADLGPRRLCTAAVARGYACFAPNYALSGEASWPAQLDDLRKALDWVQSHASEYGGDADRLGVWGLSAGAHLALVLAYEYPAEVDAVVSWSAPTDLVAWAGQRVVMKLLGCDQPCAEQAADASPTHLVRDDAPTTYIGHSQRDPVVPYWHATALDARLDQRGVEHEFATVERGHGKALWRTLNQGTFAWLARQL